MSERDAHVRCRVPEAWYELPRGAEDREARADEIMAEFSGLTPAAARALRSALVSAAEYYAMRADRAIGGWAVVGSPRTGQVDAVGIVSVMFTDTEAPFDAYVERLYAAKKETAERSAWLTFDVFSDRDGGNPSAGYYRVEVPTGVERPIAAEEALVARFFDGGAISETRVIAQDLGAIDDIVNLAAAVAGTTEVAVA